MFGMVADRIGRRKASIYSVSVFGVITLLIPRLRGYESIGFVSHRRFVLLRFVDDIASPAAAIPVSCRLRSIIRRRSSAVSSAGRSSPAPAAYVTINLGAMQSAPGSGCGRSCPRIRPDAAAFRASRSSLRLSILRDHRAADRDRRHGAYMYCRTSTACRSPRLCCSSACSPCSSLAVGA